MIKVTDTGDRISVAIDGNAKTIAVDLAALFNAFIDNFGDDNGPLLIGMAMRMSQLGKIADKWIAESDVEDDDSSVSIDDLILAAMKEARGE
jgi:hypothetical protein